MRDWDEHTVEVERSAVPLPEAVTVLPGKLDVWVEKLAKSSPLAAIRAAWRLEVLAAQTAYWPARDACRTPTPGRSPRRRVWTSPGPGRCWPASAAEAPYS
ncbi:hypothetical protein [Streptomyces sp. NPDC048200]|uniref:hypothetical protein n=1 Tax=Streptomyces sp. NPDC048200 TaxID=3365512 RepID=UPI00371C36AF